MNLRIKFYFCVVIEIRQYLRKNKGVGDLKHVEYVIPIPTFLSSNVFCSFHPLYSSFPVSNSSLCLFLPLSPSFFPSALKYTTLKHTFSLSYLLSFSSSQLFSVTFWLSFMGIFICCRALNTPDHGIQSLNLSIQGIEDTMPSPRVQGGVGKSEGVGQEFCKQEI